jgi:uncharacterized protein YlaN (UPF0358 family)
MPHDADENPPDMSMRLLVLLAVLVGADPVVGAKLTELQDAKAKFEARQSELARLPSDSERLVAIYEVDQDSLRACPDAESLTDDQFVQLNRACDAMVKEINSANLALVERMMPKAGWVSNKVYGQKAATGAFLVVQHTDDPVVQKRYLPIIEQMAASGDASPSEYAMLHDRAAVREGRLQRYGTQMHCVAGRMVPQPMEDPDRVDERRRPMKFRWATYADYTAMFGACPRSLLLAPG